MKPERRLKYYKHKGFNFSWEGKLKDIKDKFTSVDLQHKAMEWR